MIDSVEDDAKTTSIPLSFIVTTAETLTLYCFPPVRASSISVCMHAYVDERAVEFNSISTRSMTMVDTFDARGSGQARSSYDRSPNAKRGLQFDFIILKSP